MNSSRSNQSSSKQIIIQDDVKHHKILSQDIARLRTQNKNIYTPKKSYHLSLNDKLKGDIKKKINIKQMTQKYNSMSQSHEQESIVDNNSISSQQNQQCTNCTQSNKEVVTNRENQGQNSNQVLLDLQSLNKEDDNNSNFSSLQQTQRSNQNSQRKENEKNETLFLSPGNANKFIEIFGNSPNIQKQNQEIQVEINTDQNKVKTTNQQCQTLIINQDQETQIDQSLNEIFELKEKVHLDKSTQINENLTNKNYLNCANISSIQERNCSCDQYLKLFNNCYFQYSLVNQTQKYQSNLSDLQNYQMYLDQCRKQLKQDDIQNLNQNASKTNNNLKEFNRQMKICVFIAALLLVFYIIIGRYEIVLFTQQNYHHVEITNKQINNLEQISLDSLSLISHNELIKQFSFNQSISQKYNIIKTFDFEMIQILSKYKVFNYKLRFDDRMQYNLHLIDKYIEQSQKQSSIYSKFKKFVNEFLIITSI